MKENNTYILQLFSVYIDKTISEHQYKELHQWLNKAPENKQLFLNYLRFYKRSRRIGFVQNIDQEDAWNILLNKVKDPINLKVVSKTSISISKFSYLKLHFLKYAAILIGIIGLTYFFTANFRDSNQNDLVITKEDIILKLDNGKIKVITSNGTEKVLNDKGETVGTQKGNQLNYTNINSSEKLAYNELIVPYGKIFDLVLSDGTKIKLNVGSSIKYPVQFIKGKERKVFLVGEAYFDVTKDTEHPFIVNANDINVRVLGTQFNISSYPEDEQVNTVLVEGAIGLYSKGEKYNTETAIFLKPGFEAVWNKKDRNISINKADISVHTAWIDGKLIFKDLPFKIIRKKLERKYNISIINNNLLLDENTFNAVFDIETIEEVMEVLDRNFGIKYEIKNNQIIIN